MHQKFHRICMGKVKCRKLKFYSDFDGAMVAAHDVGVDFCGFQLWGCPVGAEPVVDAPPRVLLAGMETV